MAIRRTKITIIKSRKPDYNNVNTELQWFCDSLGLLGNRDKDKSCFRMFITMIKAMKNQRELTSDEIAERVGLSRGTVIHHMHKLMNSGLVVSKGNRYFLRVANMKDLVEEIERDIIRSMKNIKDIAENIDEKLEL